MKICSGAYCYGLALGWEREANSKANIGHYPIRENKIFAQFMRDFIPLKV